MNQDTFFPKTAFVELKSAEIIMGKKIYAQIRRLEDDETDEATVLLEEYTKDKIESGEVKTGTMMKKIREYLYDKVTGWKGFDSEVNEENTKNFVDSLFPKQLMEIVLGLVHFSASGSPEAEKTSGEEISSPNSPT